eukprot:gene19295-22760_t
MVSSDAKASQPPEDIKEIMSKLIQKIASEKLTPGGGETVLTGKRKRTSEEEGEITVSSKAKLNSSLRPVSGSKADKKKGGKEKKTAESSIVYLGHIPRGFEEEEIEGFFSQFGEVKRIKVFRNVKTNNIRGYAFIEFQSPEVAEVAAEAIDGYFLNDRKLVCHVIPREKIHRGMFARPEVTLLNDLLLAYDVDLDDDEEDDSEIPAEQFTPESAERKLKQYQEQQQKKQDKLKKLGYDFELPSLNVNPPSVSAAPAAAPAPASTKKARKEKK